MVARLVCLVAVASAALLAVPASLARAETAPTRQPVPDSFYNFTVPAGIGCTFAVEWTNVINDETMTTYPAAANGDVTQVLTGYVLEQFTNLSNGNSIVLNISGPGVFVFHSDGSITFTGLGPDPAIFAPTDIPAGPKFYVNYGRYTVDVTPTGRQILVSQNGTQFDVCAALS